MKKTDLIHVPEIIGKTKDIRTDRDFKLAIKKFRQNAPSASIPRLYDGYKWLKEQHNTTDEESEKHFTHFIEIFLRILEERGASGTDVYSEVLRDSAEYKYLSGLFHNDTDTDEPIMIATPEIQNYTPAAVKKISLTDILSKKNIPILDIDINEWHRLVNEHFRSFLDEELFVKSCLSAINNVNKRSEKDTYHIEKYSRIHTIARHKIINNIVRHQDNHHRHYG